MQIHFVYLNGPNAQELDNIEIAFIYLLIIEDAYCVSLLPIITWMKIRWKSKATFDTGMN